MRRHPTENPGVTAGRVWEAGTIHQSLGLPGLGQQLCDTGGLRSSIWCFMTELITGKSIQSCGVLLNQSKPGGCNKQVSQSSDECPSCQWHTAVQAEGAQVTLPAFAGAARAAAAWSPSLSRVKWTGLWNSSVERSKSRTISPKQPELQSPLLQCTSKEDTGLEKQWQSGTGEEGWTRRKAHTISAGMITFS